MEDMKIDDMGKLLKSVVNGDPVMKKYGFLTKMATTSEVSI